MSINLDSLNAAGGGTSLQDLISVPNTADTPINNEATANNIATHASLLGDPDMAVDNYQKMMGEFDTNEGSPTSDQIVQKAQETDSAKTFDQMAQMMGDETIPLEGKANLLNTWSVNSPVVPKSPQELVQTQQLSQDGAIVGNDEVEHTRLDIAGSIRQVNEYNAEIQKWINQAQTINDPSTLESLKNIAESLLPATEAPNVAEVRAKLGDVTGEETSKAGSYIKSIFALGESKEDIRARLAAVPLDKRLPLAQDIYNLVTSTNSSIVGGKNELMMMNNLRQYLVDGEYTTGDRILDDMTSILDAVGVGASIRAVKRGFSAPARIAETMGRSPMSAADTVAKVNTRSANQVYQTIANDQTGTMAKTLANSSREDAIVNHVGSEIGMEDGAVRSKPLIDDDQFDPDVDAIKKVSGPNGNIEYTPIEKQSKVNTINTDFRNDDVTGLVHHKEMTTITQTDKGVNVRTVYGPAEGGFINGDDAFDQVKLATRKYGVQEEELELLRLDANGNYSPVPKGSFTDLRSAIPANHTRFYHGGAGDLGKVSDLEDLWVTPHRDYAKGYRAIDGKDNNVWFVDIPNDRLESLGLRDTINNYNISNKLPKDELANLRRLPNELPEGNYVVGVNFTSEFDPVDTIAWSTTSVKGSFLGIPLNIFDRLPIFTKGKSGSVTQHLIPPSAYIDPVLTRSASVSADRQAHARHALFKVANEWADGYSKLDKTQKKILDNYILEANHQSLKFNPANLRARGWTNEMMSAIRSWKKTNDTLYVLDNIDLARQTRRAGFKMLEAGDTKLVVKEINNSTAGRLKITQVFDPEDGTIKAISSGEKSELYKDGGTIVIARTPIEVGDESIGYAVVRQKVGSYTRPIRDTDQLLNYRDGHFTVFYKHPVFITEEAKTTDGLTYQKAVATAPNIPAGKKHVARLQAAKPDVKYTMRSDLKDEEFEEMDWNAKVHSGRSSQRTRGELLKDTTDRPTDLDFRHILTPEESIIRSINSISRRLDTKQWVDVAKKRYMNQYKEYLPIHPETRQPFWPDNVKQLQKPDLLGDKKAFNQAVSTFRYIDQVENGFVNLLDDASKNFFKAMAETAGQKGFGWAENAARAAGEFSPASAARKKAFRLTLAANPLRQVLVQVSQALPVIIATNPTYLPKLPWHMILTQYIDRGGDVDSFFKMLGKSTGVTVDEANKLVEAYNKSGISSAVSAHSQIRDDIAKLVNRGLLQKANALVNKPLDIMQKIGFEAGENMLMRSVWLSEYDKLKKSGKAINAESLAMMHARVRDLTYNMNKAGELAYNENQFSTLMQFAQAAHKGFAQVLIGNRALTGADRARLGTAYILTFGTGYGLVYDQVSKLLPNDDRELHDIVSGGMFNLLLNRTLSTLYGEEVNVDASSSMRPFEIPNLFKFFTSMGDADLSSVAESSPSLSLVLGDNARIGNLYKALKRFWVAPEDDGNLKDVGITFASMFSGASNMFKAIYAFERGYTTSSKGDTTDPQVNEVEAMMKLFGFNTVDEMLGMLASRDVYIKSKAFKDDVKYMLDETSRRLGREGISDQEVEYVLRMYQEANRVYAGNPDAMRIVQQEVERRAQNGDYLLYNSYLKMIPLTTEQEFMDAINKAPFKPDQKAQLLKAYNFMKEKE